MRAWESLQNESSLISRGLEEARGILDFNNEVSKVSLDIVVELPDLRIYFKVEAWIREKELLVSQGDLGKDYEHCMELQRKLDDAGSGATRGVDKERIDQIFQACWIKEMTRFLTFLYSDGSQALHRGRKRSSCS